MKRHFKLLVTSLLLVLAGLVVARNNFGNKQASPIRPGENLMASPFAQAAIKGERYFLVNNEALVLKISDQPDDLPVILIDSVKNFAVGEKFIQPGIIFTIELLEKLGQRTLHPTMAKIISPQTVNIWLNNGTLVVISLQKEVDLQLDSLQVILARVKMEGKTLREIDLRFAKPVITYE